MRKITQQAVNAFAAGDNWQASNTRVVTHESMVTKGLYFTSMYLHDNLIAQREWDHELGTIILKIRDAGWQTNTTKERLNGILARFDKGCIHQRKGEWYLNGEKIVWGWEGWFEVL